MDTNTNQSEMNNNQENKKSLFSNFKMPNFPKKEETFSYKGWLNSDSFLKRAFSIYGYSLVASLIIIIPIYIIAGIIMFAFYNHEKDYRYEKDYMRGEYKNNMYMEKGMLEFQGKVESGQSSDIEMLQK